MEWSIDTMHYYIGQFYLATLLVTFMINIRDIARSWVALTLITVSFIDLAFIKGNLPNSVYISMIVYTACDLFIIYTIKKRLYIFKYLQNFLPRKAMEYGTISSVLTCVDFAPQEFAIRRIFQASVLINILMIIEHSLRHLEDIPFFDLPHSKYLYENARYIWDAYPYIKLVLSMLILIGLISMSLDSLVKRRKI